jgi:hypothetical protein
MVAMFFLVITPIAISMRLLGKRPLRLKRDPAVVSYWMERDPPGVSRNDFPNQF